MNNRVTEVLNQTGLNWNVKQEKITTESGIVLDNYNALVREDTGSVLSVHRDTYYPYQNHQLVELLDRVSQQTGLPIHRGGMFGDGKKVFLQLKSDNLLIGNDRVEGFITGVNSFDGTTSLAFGPSNITISCQNTFFAAFRGLQSKVRHTKNMDVRIDDICRGLDGIIEEEKVMFSEITRMSQERFTQKDKDWVARLLFDIKKDVDLNGYQNNDELSTVTKNRLTRFYIDLNGELQQKGDNKWGLFSGVTKYTTHSMSKGDNTENKMFGLYGNRERAIFDKLAIA